MQNMAFLVAMATTRSFYVQLPNFFACMNSGENYLEFDTTYIPFETNLNISEHPPPYFISHYMVARLFRAKQTAKIYMTCYFLFPNHAQKRFQPQIFTFFHLTHALETSKTK